VKKLAATITAVSLATCLLTPLAFADDGGDSGARASFNVKHNGNDGSSLDSNGDALVQPTIGNDNNQAQKNWKHGHPKHTKGQVNINFTDMNSTPWAQSAVKLLVQEGILSGESSAHFVPQASVTREQFARMIDAYFELSQPTSPIAFYDVPQGRWSYNYVEAASSYMDYYQGLSGGFSFHPAQTMTRQDVAIVLVKMMIHQGLATLPDATATDAILAQYSDVGNVSTAAKPYVAEAIALDLLKGEGNDMLAPQRGVTRAEAAVLLQRIDSNQLVIPTVTSGVTVTTSTTPAK